MRKSFDNESSIRGFRRTVPPPYSQKHQTKEIVIIMNKDIVDNYVILFQTSLIPALEPRSPA